MGCKRHLDEVFVWVAAEDGAAVAVAADDSTWPFIRVSCPGAEVLIEPSAAEALACGLLEAAQQAFGPLRHGPAVL